MKIHRRYIFITALVVTGAMLAWIYTNSHSKDYLRIAWMGYPYELPLVNSIFMPLLSIIVLSKLYDIEHKGDMLRQLSVSTEQGKIYDTKLIFDLAIMLCCILISWLATIGFGYYAGFGSEVPIKLYLLYLLFATTVTFSVYIFQHIMSLCFKNQAVIFFLGAIGTFSGCFQCSRLSFRGFGSHLYGAIIQPWILWCYLAGRKIHATNLPILTLWK